jgi:hypothetical protein
MWFSARRVPTNLPYHFAEGFEAHDPTLTFLGVFQAFDPLRSDPRFPTLLRRAGLAESTRPSRLHLHGTASELGRGVTTSTRATGGEQEK